MHLHQVCDDAIEMRTLQESSNSAEHLRQVDGLARRGSDRRSSRIPVSFFTVRKGVISFGMQAYVNSLQQYPFRDHPLAKMVSHLAAAITTFASATCLAPTSVQPLHSLDLLSRHLDQKAETPPPDSRAQVSFSVGRSSDRMLRRIKLDSGLSSTRLASNTGQR